MARFSGLNRLKITQTPTITAGAYSDADALGGKLTFQDAAAIPAGTGMVTSLVVIMNDPNDSPDLDLVLMNADFTATADNAALSISDADMLNVAGVVKVRSGDYIGALGANRFAYVETAIPFFLPAGERAIYGQMVLRVAHTFGATDEVVVILTVERD